MAEDAGGVSSPVTGGPTEIVETRPTSEIRDLYERHFGIDVGPHLGSTVVIERRRCRDTGYEFFFPHDLAGSPEFYRALYSAEAGASWAYKGLRWEFGIAAELVSDGVATLLDIGAGGGDFLALVRRSADAVAGLETSPYGRAVAADRGLTLLDETIERHAERHPGAYDLITAFQVLEHVCDVAGFVRGCVAALKPGGRLVLAVPDNDGFVGMQRDLPLNLPPHHMGLWRARSLAALADHFDLRLLRIEREPLQTDNIGWYQSEMERRYLPASRIAKLIYYRAGLSKYFNRFLHEQAHTISGHTILALYQRI